jgi:hypothetical protein
MLRQQQAGALAMQRSVFIRGKKKLSAFISVHPPSPG